jgi:methionine-rich copper-binding protein CopC
MYGIGFLLLPTGNAAAHVSHARVIHSTPATTSTITHLPASIKVQTIQNMDTNPQNSNLTVYGPDGQVISQGDAHISLNNPREMSVTLKKVQTQGIYIVQWKTRSSEDGESDQGAFTFSVKAKPVVTSTTATVTTPTTHTNTISQKPAWVPIVSPIVGLLAGFIIGGAAQRRCAMKKVRKLETELKQRKEQEQEQNELATRS